MKENLYKQDSIRTFTGKYVNVFDPDPETICIEDIVHSLSNICRFGGHTQSFYSVAQHCIYVADHLPEELKLTGLLHDAAEAYLIDLPNPIKEKMSEYVLIEDKLMRLIAEKFGIIYPFPELVKQADKNALEFEWKGIVLTDEIICCTPYQAKKIFLNQYKLNK